MMDDKIQYKLLEEHHENLLDQVDKLQLIEQLIHQKEFLFEILGYQVLQYIFLDYLERMAISHKA